MPPAAWGLVAAAVVLGWGGAVGFRWYRLYAARKKLLAAITSVGSDHLVDVMVPDGMGSGFHVDFLILTPRGILVVDLRDVAGTVFGGDQMSEWTVMEAPSGRFTFVNPQSALYDRVAAVRALVSDVPVEGRIVFTRRARFPKGLPKWTLTMDSLLLEFPPADSTTVAEIQARFQPAWEQVKAAVTPSPLGQPRRFGIA
jgi:hypothetical protein